MHIQSYFKNGKPKKSVHKIESVEKTMKLFENMNNSKDFPLYEVNNNFKQRDIVFDDGSKCNLWDVMKENGFDIELPF